MKTLIFIILSVLIVAYSFAATGDKPNQMVVEKRMSAQVNCTKGELGLKNKRLYVCYTTNTWTYANMSAAGAKFP